MNTPNNLEWLENELNALVGVGFLMVELGKPLDSDIQKKAVEVIKQTIATKLAEAYRQGYNDNSRDCICDSVDYRGFTERVPHRHLMDDGDSHDIRPDALTNDKELEQ